MKSYHSLILCVHSPGEQFGGWDLAQGLSQGLLVSKLLL